MPKKMPKKMTVVEAISFCMQEYEMPVDINQVRMDKQMEQCYDEYEKEQAATAKKIAQRVAEEMKIAWDERDWEEYIQSQENECDTAECIRRYFEELEMKEDSDSEQHGPQKDMKAAKRRKQEARHKGRVRRNALNAVKNNGKRGEDDQQATACRGGYIVENPKSLTMKTERIWNQAEKMKLVSEEDLED